MSLPAPTLVTRALIVAVALTGAGALALATAPSSSAHSELISASPAEDELLTRPPKSVVLTFGEGVVSEGSAIVVTGPDGERYDDKSSLQVEGEQASVGLLRATASGSYEVAFRVVSADGHVVEDIYDYRLKLPASVSSSATPTASPTPSATTSPTAEPSTSPAGSTDEDSDSSLVWVLGAAAIGLALVAALVAVILRRRRA